MIQGGSAGGCWWARCSNMRPGLFEAVRSGAVRGRHEHMLDASLPLTTSEYIEWGNPNERAEFDDMLNYSPYHNVNAQDYPRCWCKSRSTTVR